MTSSSSSSSFPLVSITVDSLRVRLGSGPSSFALSLPALDFPSGSLSLIFAPPGHGGSSVLRSLSGRLRGHGGCKWEGGTIAYKIEQQGKTKYYQADQTADFHPVASSSSSDSLVCSKLVGLLDQVDCHLPHLTIKETVEFACRTRSAQSEYDPAASDSILSALSLSKSSNTLVRSASGGEARRLSLAELLASNSRVLCLDQLTNGLDSHCSHEIFSYLQSWARSTGGVVVCTLTQPSQEILGLMDQLIVLNNGGLVYSGPPSLAESWMAQSVCAPWPAQQEQSEWIMEMISKSGKTEDSNNSQQGQEEGNKTTTKDGSSPVPVIPSPDAFTSAFLRSSDYLTRLQPAIEARRREADDSRSNGSGPEELFPAGSEAARLYCHSLSCSYWTLFVCCLSREYSILSRNRLYVLPRLAQILLLSLLIGFTFYDLDLTNDHDRISCLFAGLAFLGVSSVTELPHAHAGKRVLIKHYYMNMIHLKTHLLALYLAQLLVIFPEALILCSITFSLTNIIPGVAFIERLQAFALYFLVMFFNSTAIAAIFRCFAFAITSFDVAAQLITPSTGLSFIFTGFLIAYNKLLTVSRAIYWLVPYSWALRAIVVLEFTGPQYISRLVYDSAGHSQSLSSLVLERHGFAYAEGRSAAFWSWTAIAYSLFINAFTLFIAEYRLKSIPAPYIKGTAIAAIAAPADGAATDARDDLQPMSKLEDTMALMVADPAMHSDADSSLASSFSSSVLSCSPATLVFDRLSFVKFAAGNAAEREILKNVQGVVEPGKLTALMGLSAAGKTCLLDVLAGRLVSRPRSHRVSSRLFVNGHRVRPEKLHGLVNYVEQQDLVDGTSTVAEAMEFNARLLLASESPAARSRLIHSILDCLELLPLQERLANGLSPGELKRLNLAIQLLSRRPFLFLDEPTSLLDSQSSLIILRVLKRLAAHQRTILVTIHRPSAALFDHFDSLIMLDHGQPVYVGPCQLIRQRFEHFPGYSLPAHANPIEYIMELVQSQSHTQIQQFYEKQCKQETERAISERLRESADDEDEDADDAVVVGGAASINADSNNAINTPLLPRGRPADSTAASSISSTHTAGAPFWASFSLLLSRLYYSYTRSPSFLFTRWRIALFQGVVFGLIFLRLSATEDYASLMGQLGAIFAGLIYHGIATFNSILFFFIRQRPLFYREQYARLYSPVVYSLAIGVIELPFVLIDSILLVTPFYFLVGFQVNAASFFLYLLFDFLVSYFFSSFAQFVVYLFPDLLLMNNFRSLSLNLMMIYSGIFIRPSMIPDHLYWIYSYLALAKGVAGIAWSQFKDSSSLILVMANNATQGIVQETQARYMEDYLMVDYHSSPERFVGRQLFNLIFIVLIFRVLIAIICKFIRYSAR